jgi:hypothetical protein
VFAIFKGVKVVFNIRFWERFIQNQLIRQVTMFVENIQTRLLPTFDDIENEANKVEEQEWNKLCSSYASPDIDPANLAEKAHDAGLDYYMMVSGVKQSLLNVTAITLYHLFEQQLLFFLRREILHPSEENNIDLIKISVFKERCLQHNINIEQFPSWQTINEMRLVTNTAKHAEGKSAVELRQIRPDLFINPILKKHELKLTRNSNRLYMPLAGEDLYLSVDDLKNYKEAIIRFWEEMISEMYQRN